MHGGASPCDLVARRAYIEVDDLRIGAPQLQPEIDRGVAGAATGHQHAKAIREWRLAAITAEIDDVEVVEPGSDDAAPLIVGVPHGIRELLVLCSDALGFGRDQENRCSVVTGRSNLLAVESIFRQACACPTARG